MKLVLVHGRAQEGLDEAELRKSWMDALAYGMARADLSLPAGTSVEFPYYGNTLAWMVAQINAPIGLEINPKGPNPDADRELRGEIILEMAANAGVREEDVRRELGEQPIQKGPQNWAWVQATLRAMDHLPGVNSHFIDLVTRDVYVYLQARAVRMAIDGLVRDAIGTEPSVVVSHSLGTVVSYNVLLQRPEAPGVIRFVTLGSPLGIRGLKRKLDKPLRHPACVGSWFNAYDRRDVVSLVPLDASTFDIVPAIENRGEVDNFTDNRHGIEGYLADPVVARRIVEALE